MLRSTSNSNSSESTFNYVIVGVFYFGMELVEHCYGGFLS